MIPSLQPRSETVQLSGLAHRLLSWQGPTSTPAILMLHGWLDQALSLAPIAKELSRISQVLALDFRGHGHSDWIGRGGYYHFFDYLRDVSELLQDQRLARRPIWLVGHSMGGSVASLVAGALPDAIAGLVLLEGSGPPARPASAAVGRSQRWLQDLRRFSTGPRYFQDQNEMKARIAATYPEFSEELVARFTDQASVHEARKGWRWRYDPLHRCTNPMPFLQDMYVSFANAYPGPVLQIYGENSPLARRDDAKVQARDAAFSGERTQVQIDQAGHMMHLSHPLACAEAIGDWLCVHKQRLGE